MPARQTDREAKHPSPLETEELAAAEIREVAQRRLAPSHRALRGFLREAGTTSCVTPKRDPRTNIIDQGERVTYAMPNDRVQRMLDHLEKCRRAGATTHISERQGSPESPRAGLMLDYDFLVTSPRARFDERHAYRISAEIARVLWRDLEPETAQRDMKLHVFSIVKPKPVPMESHFKYGFHMLVPGLRLTRGFKKHVLRELAGNSRIGKCLSEMGIVGDPAKALDMNSASVPVLFVGSCKRGKTPYVLGAAHTVEVDVVRGPRPSGYEDFDPVVVGLDLKRAEAEGWNLVAEASLCFTAEYPDGRAPMVEAREADARPELEAKISDIEARTQGGTLDAEELLVAEHSLSALALHDPEARYLHQLLDLLDESYATDRNKWRNVVFALANTSATYLPLAEWFSQKCPAKWADGGADALAQLWSDAVEGGAQVEHPITKRSLIRWAKECNPERFRQVSERSYFTLAAKYVYDFGGMLEHYMVANILAAMLSTKFVVDVGDGHMGGFTYCWYEFVVPGQAANPGEVWKWRKEVEPDVLHTYLSERLPNVFTQIAEHIEENKAEALGEDEDQARYLTKLGATLQGSMRRLYNDTFKNGVLRQARYIFRRRGFAESLDRNPDILGVGNGLLRLGARAELIDHFHEYPVSLFTPVAYRRFDPANPWTRLMLDAVADIIPEPDAREYILMFAASSLRGGVKEGIMLMWHGGGANGKTFFMRMVAKALGSNYAKKLNISLLTSERESADRPNSAVMQLKGCRWGYVEETQKAEVLQTQRMKEIVNPGEISGRELNQRQETFEVTANLAVGHNFPFIISTRDNGTWRRLRFYNSKVVFCADPDPENPLEKKDDQRFVREYVNDPDCQAAFLGILVHYYERLQREYGGLLKNVPCPTIERETQIYRNSQDSINRFITESVVVSPECKEELDLTTVSEAYVSWYRRNVDNQGRINSIDARQDLEASALQKYLRWSRGQRRVVVGCRLLTPESRGLMRGEEHIGAARAEAKAVDVFAGFEEADGWWNGSDAAAVRPQRAAEPDEWHDEWAHVEEKKRPPRPGAQAAPSDDGIEDLARELLGGPPAGEVSIGEAMAEARIFG